jgi:hypothetical protein
MAAHLEAGDIGLLVLMTLLMFLFLHPRISTCERMQPLTADSCVPQCSSCSSTDGK